MAVQLMDSSTLDTDRELVLSEVLGHERTREILGRMLGSGELPGALLFSGPEAVGKKTLAWALVREIVAAGGDAGTHPGSLKVVRGTHPDVRLYDQSQSPSGQILIGAIREIEDWTATAPLESPKKIVMIAPAEAMNVAAANALLKLLEEPPAHLQLILISSDPARLLPTIRSRCSALTLEPVAAKELGEWLTKRDAISVDRAELIVRLSEGRPGRAREIVDKDFLSSRLPILQELIVLKNHGFAAIFGVADRLRDAGGKPATLLATMVLLLRDAVIVQMGIDRVINFDLEEPLRELADGVSSEGLLGAAEAVEEGLRKVSGYYTPQAQAHFLELLVVDIGKELRSR